MPSILDSVFWSIFGRFWLSTWTHLIQKTLFFITKNKVFWQIAIRSSHRFLIPFWSQLGFILKAKIHKISSINRPQEASKKRSIFASIFNRFLIDFGGELGAMLAAFSAQQGGGCEKLASFLLRCFFEPIFFEMLTHFGSILLHFGAKLAPFWLHVAAILVLSWRYLGPLGRTSWHWMGWWGYAKR